METITRTQPYTWPHKMDGLVYAHSTSRLCVVGETFNLILLDFIKNIIGFQQKQWSSHCTLYIVGRTNNTNSLEVIKKYRHILSFKCLSRTIHRSLHSPCPSPPAAMGRSDGRFQNIRFVGSCSQGCC